MSGTCQEACQAAMRLLADREHSERELVKKLKARGYEQSVIEACMDELVSTGLQSDDRYTEALIRSCISRGKGLLYLKKIMQERGGSTQAMLSWCDQETFDWSAHAIAVLEKKFGAHYSNEENQAKALRFLKSRGFDERTICSVLID